MSAARNSRVKQNNVSCTFVARLRAAYLHCSEFIFKGLVRLTFLADRTVCDRVTLKFDLLTLKVFDVSLFLKNNITTQIEARKSLCSSAIVTFVSEVFEFR